MTAAGTSPREPIAITGASCRLPGAPGLAAFWDLMVGERDAVGEMPPERSESGSGPSLPGGFLADIDEFDAGFFSVAPREAIRLDPQHRLLLETTWEALEDAGLPASQLAGSRTGVYTSCLASGYWDLLRRANILDLYATLGAGPWQVPAGRISYHLDLRGPSLGVEATCATSLLAVHLACQALWSGETALAVVGGANLLVTPDLFPVLDGARVLSPEGRCRFGDAGADGYVRSEGVVAMVLRPLSQAVEAGDRIYASILGTGSTHDGRTGRTAIAPGQESQEDMLRIACQDAGVPPGEIDYVEAHGTGTTVGDGTELSALSAVLRQGRDPGRPCLVGSVKSNVGHGEGVAGLVGLLKTALVVQHRTIPATLHVSEPNPVLAEQAAPLRLATRTQPWPDRGRRVLAGVSAFGLSGTNVHAILTQAPAQPLGAAHRAVTSAYLLPLSARDPAALRELASAYADKLSGATSAAALRDICFSAGARRTGHDHRIAAVGTTVHAIGRELRTFASGARARSVIAGPPHVTGRPRVVFVFPGQGAQWTGMGRQLLAQCPPFRRRLRQCARAIERERGWSPETLLARGLPLRDVEDIQCTLWVIQVALAAVWREWGIEPDLVIGHSMGEIAAATVAGALTLEDAAAVTCRRSRLIATLPRTGGMCVVLLGEAAAREAIGEHSAQVCVGVINSEHSVVLSGDSATLGRVVGPLREQGVFCRDVAVDYASHSPHVEPLRAGLVEALGQLRPRPASTPLFSTALDRMTDGTELDGRYWMENLRQPVRFASAAGSALSEEQDTLFVEISPHPTLIGALEDIIDARAGRGQAVNSLHRDRPELESLLTALGVAYVRGCAPDWRSLYPGASFTSLPSYPWQRGRFWPAATGHGRPGASPATGTAPATATLPAPGGARPVEAVGEFLARSVSELSAIPRHDLREDVSLMSLGLDSLIAHELQLRIEHELGVRVPVRHLIGTSTLAGLTREVQGRLA